ncbi:DeoR/GlpR family DNA-binding transcription regulator [Mucilaginibacter gotjawali]|uniref:DeoR family fructose operon transcriptional repressor n=2 Tax=Mucilaginibacter gotjawali TaxID=1550579 RepID=A0A839SET1_9SPHI|nr:DeoR/GlpR family DNA-binding transcription regulator [Mucilaginibacter gotjawali]MBB3056306.1 DeoR family fructose operon transcriptional repressor [Mucilaginibacter gotjawali]BAU55010.1 Lactose phosphotransferase system repressor [Mucilaginibacter gotjawali]
MNFPKRKQKILAQLDKDDQVDVKQLADELQISEITIRRDLNHLAADGLLYRTHGGATKVNPFEKPHDFANKAARNAAAKDEICRVAASQINDGDVIFMDCGSTVFRLCQFIKNKKIKVITNSLPVICELQNCAVSLNIIGGEFDKDRQAVHGSMAIEHISKYRASKAFLGVDGISENGLFAGSENEASITTAFANSCAYTYLLCDASKIGRESYLRFADVSLVNALITNADKDKLVGIEKRGVFMLSTKK